MLRLPQRRLEERAHQVLPNVRRAVIELPAAYPLPARSRPLEIVTRCAHLRTDVELQFTEVVW